MEKYTGAERWVPESGGLRKLAAALPDGTPATVTVHPSAVVRSREFRRDFAQFVADLQVAVELIG